MGSPWIHCIPELLCQGLGLEPHYSAILGLFMHSHGTCYLQPSMNSPMNHGNTKDMVAILCIAM